MVRTEPPDAPIFRRLEKCFEGARLQGWYKADIDLSDAMTEEVWVLSVYDRGGRTYAWRRGRYAVIADNTYFGAVALSTLLPRLMEPHRPELCQNGDIYVGNFKLYFAEAELRRDPKGVGRSLLIEYLFECDHLNRNVTKAVREMGAGFPVEQTLGSLATFLVILHEVAHFAFLNKAFSKIGQDAVTAWFDREAPGCPDRARIEEEAFCDLYAAINVIREFGRDGFDMGMIAEMVAWARLSIFLAMLIPEHAATSHHGGGSQDYSDHEFLLRHRCARDLVAAEVGAWRDAQDTIKYALPFVHDDTVLLTAMAQASSCPVQSEALRVMSRFMLAALESGRADPFTFLQENVFQIYNVSDETPDINL